MMALREGPGTDADIVRSPDTLRSLIAHAQRVGYDIGLADGAAALREIGHMVSRTAFTEFRYSFVLLIATIAGLMTTYLVPVALALPA